MIEWILKVGFVSCCLSVLLQAFARLGGEDQIIRALRELVREGRLVRLGYGVYARAERSRLSGRPVLTARDGSVSTGSPRKQSAHTTRAGQRRCQPMRSSGSKAASLAVWVMAVTTSWLSDGRDP